MKDDGNWVYRLRYGMSGRSKILPTLRTNIALGKEVKQCTLKGQRSDKAMTQNYILQ